MGYYLQAFIGRKPGLQSIASNYHHAKIVELEQGIAIIPMTDELYDEINKLMPSENIGRFMFMKINVENEILGLTRGAEIGYIEADYHGSAGGQQAILWKDNTRIRLFEFDQDAINSVLQYFEVVKDEGK